MKAFLSKPEMRNNIYNMSGDGYNKGNILKNQVVK